jgi:hypothetical protein
MVHGDTCCVASGNTDVVQRHERKIEGVVSLEPAHVAAHAGAMLQATLAGRGEGDGGAPASLEPSTLWGEAGRLGLG